MESWFSFEPGQLYMYRSQAYPNGILRFVISVLRGHPLNRNSKFDSVHVKFIEQTSIMSVVYDIRDTEFLNRWKLITK